MNVIVNGQPLDALPDDLYIPPDALRVWLDSFSGPLDLLLYLIRKQNIDLLDIPVALITEQYLAYIELMEVHQLELAAEYLLMAALLAEIKSKLLLPQLPDIETEEGHDPRLELVEKLKAYEEMQRASRALDELPRLEREHFSVTARAPEYGRLIPLPDVALNQLVDAMASVLKGQSQMIHHTITREQLSLRERMALILTRLKQGQTLRLEQLFESKEGRQGLTVSVLAILELAKQSVLMVSQAMPFATVYIQLTEET